LENNFRKLDEIKRLKQVQNEIDEKKQNYQDLINEMNEAFASFNKCTHKIKEAEELEKRTDLDFNIIKISSELDLYERNLLKYEQYILSLEKEINKITKKISDINNGVQKLKDRMLNLKKEAFKLNKIISAKKNEIQITASPINNELKELRKDIDPKIMEVYTKVRKQRKMPVFVPYMDDSCFACGIKISIEVGELLKNAGDFAECPNCRRIVYKKENK
jgi:predicted  nucleic acid-binding Zn-ribbon protein